MSSVQTHMKNVEERLVLFPFLSLYIWLYVLYASVTVCKLCICIPMFRYYYCYECSVLCIPLYCVVLCTVCV